MCPHTMIYQHQPHGTETLKLVLLKGLYALRWLFYVIFLLLGVLFLALGKSIGWLASYTNPDTCKNQTSPSHEYPTD